MTLSPQFYVAILLALIMGSGYWYISTLHSRIEGLLIDKTSLTTSLKVEKTNLTVCSDNTGRLKTDQEMASANLVKKMQEAEDLTVANKKLALQLRNARPADVVITPENRDQFGPKAADEQLKDYTASHDLINNYITKINE